MTLCGSYLDGTYNEGLRKWNNSPEAIVMAAVEMTDYIENGIIVNSVNFPGVKQARESKTRICVINKNVPNILARISNLFADHNLNIENMVNRSRGEYAYTLIDTNDEVRQDIIDRIETAKGVINVRVIVD